MFLWDCHQGAPMPAGPDGERWCVEFAPVGRVAPTRMHFPNWRAARQAFRALAAGKPDEWGFWDASNLERSEQYVGQTSGASREGQPVHNGGSGSESGGLSARLRAEFPLESVMEIMLGLCRATRPTPTGPEPDWTTRAAGIKLLLAYRVGLPIQRKEEVTRRETSDAEIVARLITKPGYRQAMLNFIISLENQASAGQRNSPLGTPEHLARPGP